MSKQTLFALVAMATLGTSIPALAHHSAAEYDFGNEVQVTGIVKSARFSNPHAKIVLEVTDEKGTRDIEFEGHSRNNLIRTGLTPQMMPAGQKITIVIAPLRKGGDGGYMTGFITPDGKRVGLIRGAD